MFITECDLQILIFLILSIVLLDSSFQSPIEKEKDAFNQN